MNPAPLRPLARGGFFAPSREGQGRVGSQALADFRLVHGVYVRHTSMFIQPFFTTASQVVCISKLALILLHN